jgi:16S rRNA processing protein RimM
VFVHVFSKDVSWIDQLKEIILEDLKGQRISFQVLSLRPHKEGFLVFLDRINDRTAAEKIRAHLVFVSAELFISDSGDNSFYLSEIEGFKVFDQTHYLGEIVGFGSNSVQDLIIIQIEKEKVEIPLVEDFLESIEFEKGEVHMKLPRGLVDVQINKK